MMTGNPRSKTVVALLVFSGTMVAGCSSSQSHSPVKAIFAFDVSCPAKARMLQYAQVAYGAQRRLPSGTQLRVYLFGHGCDLVYVGERIAGRDEFNRKIGAVLANPPPHLLISGTQTDRVLEQIAEDVSSSRSSMILVATDGGIEDQTRPALIRLNQATKALSNAHGLKTVVLIGVAPAFRNQWETWLKPLGERAFVRGDHDAGDGVAELLVAGGSQ